MSSEFTLGPAMLFVPGDRPERFAKAAERADAVIIDLEDAVLPGARDAAREQLVSTPLDPDSTVVRVNPAGTADFAKDLAALRRTKYRWVMLAKTESAAQTQLLGGFSVVALCETALGVARAQEIAHAENVAALMWGSEDLVASLGGFSSRYDDGRFLDVIRFGRAAVHVAARAFGKESIDSVVLDIADHERLLGESRDAFATGYVAKACIHPGQVSVIRDGFRPSREQREWARRVLDAAKNELGAFRFEGAMVDEVVVKRARRLSGQSFSLGVEESTSWLS